MNRVTKITAVVGLALMCWSAAAWCAGAGYAFAMAWLATDICA